MCRAFTREQDMRSFIAGAILISLGLIQCSRPAEAPPVQQSVSASVAAPAPGYDVELTLSDGALKKLQGMKEKITFSAWPPVWPAPRSVLTSA